MSTKIITAFYSLNGVPKTGLSPTIDIYLLDPLVPSTNTLVVNAASLVEIGGGWYRYDFTTYNYGDSYVFTVDAGTDTIDSRYQAGGNDSFQEDISSQVWEEPSTSHLGVGTMGLLENQTAADSSTTNINVTTALSIVQIILKYQKNRTRIDPNTMTLTVYDTDGVTPLTVFDLKDQGGNLSIASVYERDPH